MLASLTFFASHWVLIIATVLAVIGLGVAAYVLKNLKFAVAALAVAVAGFLYQGAVTSGIKIQMEKELAEQVEIANNRLATINTLTLKDAMQAKKDADDNDALAKSAGETPKNDSPCLDIDAARRVRAIGGPAEPVATTVPARGPTSLLPWRSKHP